MDIIFGTVLLLVVLGLFTLFSYKAPNGMKAMGALANAACASLLVEAFHFAFFDAVLTGLAVSGFGILPGFIAGYLISYVVKFLEKKVPAGLDLIAIIIIAAPLSRLIATGVNPIVNGTLLKKTDD